MMQPFPDLSRAGAIAGMLCLLAGCGRGPALTPEALNESYLDALSATTDRAGVFVPGGEREAAALARLEGYFGSMTPDSVEAQTAGIYAPDAYLNDNLAAISGADAIQRYFRHAAGQVEELHVVFEDIARSGNDFYVRWAMTLRSDTLNDGRPLVSLGVTHFRLDANGRILIHKDFWDAATGLHEYLPVVGAISRRIRAGAALAAMEDSTE